MEMTQREQDGVQIISLSGKIMGGAEEDRLSDKMGELIDEKKIYIVFDLSNVTWMNSLGLGICLEGLTRLRNRGGDLRLVGVPRVVESLMERCRILRLFQCYDSVDEALSSF